MIHLLLFTLFAAVSAQAAERWEVQYFYDENQSSIVLNDLKFPSAQRGIAGGYVLEKGKSKPVVVITSDGGQHWSQVVTKEYCQSLFFLDDSLGWMVTDKGVWQTEESGRSWKKLNTPKEMKDMLRVWFVSREHGWAVGDRKQIFETTDGGAKWTPLAAAAEPKVNPDFTTYGWITFGNSKDGIISGWNEPPRRGGEMDWMDPAKTKQRRQLPSTMILLQTRDGGQKWNPGIASIFGRMSHISIAPDGSSLGLVEFPDLFQYPSEVYHANSQDGNNTRVYRAANRAISDVLLTPSHAGYLSGVEITGVVRNSPIPGKLKILKSTDLSKWEEMTVDYRANAHRTFLASSDEKNIWVGTDTGMILKLKMD